jgi:hypothetical protein
VKSALISHSLCSKFACGGFVPGEASAIDDIAMGFEDLVGAQLCDVLTSFTIDFTRYYVNLRRD